MINLKDYNKNKDVKNFIKKMFEVRQVSHNAHLKTKSYSEHVALDTFYNELLSHADEFIETFQGQYGLIGDLEFTIPLTENIVNYLEEFASLTKSIKENIKESHLQNILDEITSLTYRTIYKLKFLS